MGSLLFQLVILSDRAILNLNPLSMLHCVSRNQLRWIIGSYNKLSTVLLSLFLSLCCARFNQLLEKALLIDVSHVSAAPPSFLSRCIINVLVVFCWTMFEETSLLQGIMKISILFVVWGEISVLLYFLFPLCLWRDILETIDVTEDPMMISISALLVRFFGFTDLSRLVPCNKLIF